MSADAPAEPIELVSPDPVWPARYAAEERLLRDVLGALALRIDHVGSTSIPGIDAKPIIDIQVSVASLHPLDRWRERLAAAGYRHAPSEDDGHYPFFHKPEDWPHSHHVHVCASGSWDERRHLAFCAYLRDHPGEAREYERVKHRLAKLHSAATMASRNAYADAKSEFIAGATERALAAGYPR